MVSIAAFQAVDPGSIPGRRRFLFIFCILQTNKDGIHQKGHWGYCDTGSGDCLKTRPESRVTIEKILNKVGRYDDHFFMT